MKYPLVFEMVDLSLVYVNSPRCACTSTKIMLADLMGVEKDWAEDSVHQTFANGYLPGLKRHRDISKVNDSYHKFTVVRNPFGRVVSFYVGKGKGKIAREWYDAERDDTFKDFVRKFYSLGMDNLEEHLVGQYRGFRLEKMDTVIHLESYSEEIELIKSRFDQDVKTYWKNSSGKDNYRKYYDEETRGMVAELYSNDLENLNYEF